MTRETVLVTGATGFIGSHVVNHLVSIGSYQVVAIVRRDKDYKNVNQLKEKGVTLVQGAFYDTNVIREVFGNFAIRNVVHMAALRGSGVGNMYHQVNVLGTKALVEASGERGVRKFVFMSSVGVFGTTPADLPANLRTRFCGDNEYHRSKILAETLVNGLSQKKDIDVCTLRPTITYGEGATGFPKILVDYVRRKLLLLPQKDILIHLLDVRALAQLVSEVLGSEKTQEKAFIVADDSPVSLNELVNLIHTHYFGQPYPGFLRIPVYLLKAFRICFAIFGNDRWKTRMKLLSGSWYYDIQDTIRTFGFHPAGTKDSFIRSMCECHAE